MTSYKTFNLENKNNPQKEKKMVLKKIALIAILCFSFLLTAQVNSQQSAQEKAKGPVAEYEEQLRTLAQNNMEKKFNELIIEAQGLKTIITSDLEPNWTEIYPDPERKESMAAVIGQHIANIIKINIDNPTKISHIANYIRTLANNFSSKNYQTVAWLVYKKISPGLVSFVPDSDSNTEKTLMNQLPNVDSGPSRQAFTNLKELSDKLPQLSETIYQSQMKAQWVDKFEKVTGNILKSMKQLSTQADVNRGFLIQVKNFIHTNVGWFIIGLMIMFSISFVFNLLYLRKRLKVKMLFSTGIDEEKNGHSQEPVSHKSPGVKQKDFDDPSRSFYVREKPQKNGKKNMEFSKSVSIKKGFDLIQEEIAKLKVPGIQTTDGMTKDEIEHKFASESEKVNASIDDKLNALKADSFDSLVNTSKDFADTANNLIAALTASQDSKVPPAIPAGDVLRDIVTYEKEYLKKLWKWRPSDDEKKKLFDSEREVKERKEFLVQCSELSPMLNFNDELASYYGNILAPLKDYQYKLSELLEIVEVIGKEITDPQNDLFEIKKKTSFLMFIHSLNAIPELLKFNLEKWFENDFLDFASEFLKRYQKEEFSNTMTRELEVAYSKIQEILAHFDIEPISITLGQTTFNSKMHDGQSTINDPDMMDEAIAEVITNGFQRKNGKIINRPVVIVNRRKNF